MRISEINENTREAYDCLSRAEGTLFNAPEWLDLYENKVTRYGFFDNSDNLIGGFYLYKQRFWILNFYRNPPFSPHIGFFLINPAKNPSKASSFHKGVVSDMAGFISTLPGHIVSFAFDTSMVDLQPFIWKKFKVVPNYTYVIDLRLSENDLLSGFSAERRNDISKALRDGIAIKQVSDYSVVSDLVLKTFTRKAKSLDLSMVKSILFRFANTDNSFAFVAYDGDVAVSCTFCIRHESKAYYMLGGYDNSNHHHGGGAVCVWESIRMARNLGCELFDFEGSMMKPVEKYFRGFGGKITPYFTVNKAWLPIEIGLKLVKREVF